MDSSPGGCGRSPDGGGTPGCRAPLGGRSALAAQQQEFGGALGGDRLHGVAGAQRSVGFAVGDVGTEAALVDHHRSIGGRVAAQLLQRPLGRLGTPPLGLRQDPFALLQRDREQQFLRLQRAIVVSLLDVGAVAAVVGGHRGAVGGRTDHPRQRQHIKGIVEGHCLQAHAGQQRRGLRLRLGGTVSLADLDVGTEPPRAGDHRQTAVRVGAQHPIFVRRLKQLQRALGGRLVGSDLRRDVGARLAALQVGAVATDPDQDAGAVAIAANHHRVDGAGIDVSERVRHHRLQSRKPVRSRRRRSAIQPRQHFLVTGGDVVEFILHARRKGVVDQIGEVPLQQVNHRKRGEGANQGGALLQHPSESAASRRRFGASRPSRMVADASRTADAPLRQVATRQNRRPGREHSDGSGNRALDRP